MKLTPNRALAAFMAEHRLTFDAKSVDDGRGNLPGWYPRDKGIPTDAMLSEIAARVPQAGWQVFDTL